MVKLYQEGEYIVNKATDLDWLMHKQRGTRIYNINNGPKHALLQSLKESDEFMIIRDYVGEKESEFSIIVKDGDEYYFKSTK